MRMLLTRIVERRNINIECNKQITKIAENKIVFTDGDEIEGDCIVWATGAEPHDLQHNMNK